MHDIALTEIIHVSPNIQYCFSSQFNFARQYKSNIAAGKSSAGLELDQRKGAIQLAEEGSQYHLPQALAPLGTKPKINNLLSSSAGHFLYLTF
jgi:hypothetical protein